MAANVNYARSARFLARGSQLRQIGGFLEDFCGAAGIARERCLRLNVVLEELFVNTIRHGYRGERDAPVWVTLEARPHEVRVTYEDAAPAFNPYAHLPANPGAKVGGLGVLLTHELTAEREYAYLFGRNRIRLALTR
jgi:serine/threonine-protein kinase RsbW